jgi:hypothetical protein
LSVVGGKSGIRSDRIAGAHPGYVIRAVFGEVEAKGVSKGGIAIVIRGGLGDVGIAHPADVAKGAEKSTGLGGGVEEEDRSLFDPIVREGPCHARRLDRGQNIRTRPKPSTRRIDGTVRIERVYFHAVHVPGAAIVGPAKPGPCHAVVVVNGVRARIPAVLRIRDDVPSPPTIGSLITLIRPPPPIDGRNDRVLGVLGVHTDTAITARPTSWTIGRGHVGPSEGGGIQFPNLSGLVISAVVATHPESAIASEGTLHRDHTGRPARNHRPVGAAVRRTIDVAVAGSHRLNPHIEGRGGAPRCTVWVDDHP